MLVGSAVFRLPLSKLFVTEGKEWVEAGAAALMPSKADAPTWWSSSSRCSCPLSFLTATGAWLDVVGVADAWYPPKLTDWPRRHHLAAPLLL